MRRHQRGYSIIELLIYTGVLVLIVAVIGGTLLALARSYRTITAQQRVQASAQALERITAEIRKANSIDSGDSIFNTSPGALSLNTKDDGGNPTTVRFSVGADDRIHLSQGGVDEGPLMPLSSDVSSLVFTSISTGESQAVRIVLTVESGTSSSYISRTFYSTAVLRGSYTQ